MKIIKEDKVKRKDIIPVVKMVSSKEVISNIERFLLLAGGKLVNGYTDKDGWDTRDYRVQGDSRWYCLAFRYNSSKDEAMYAMDAESVRALLTRGHVKSMKALLFDKRGIKVKQIS